MKRVLAMVLVLVLAPATAGAFLGGSFKVALRDEATGKSMDSAFVIAREWAEVGKLHGSDEYCVRADITAVRDPFVTMDLPSAGTDMITRARGIEAIAYRPGYCVARTESAQQIASYKHLAVGQAPPKEIDMSGETRLQMRRAGPDPEERLLYLTQMLPLFTCTRNRWSDRSTKSFELFREAVLSEARMLARTRYEKGLVHRLGQRVVTADAKMVQPIEERQNPQYAPTPTSFPRDFFVGADNVTVKWTPNGIVVAAARPTIQAAAPMPVPAPADGVRRIGDPRLPHSALGGIAVGKGLAKPDNQPAPAIVIHCRHGEVSKCDLDERDGDGRTAIFSAVYHQTSAEEVKVLLDAGADPSIPARPFGSTPIEFAILQLLRMSPSPNRDRLAKIIDVLAAHPKTTIPQWLKDDLAADPATWGQVSFQPGYRVLVERREALAKLPARPERQRGCEPLLLPYSSQEHSSLEEFPRLRPPRK